MSDQKQTIYRLKDCFRYIRLLIKQKDKDGAKRVLSDAYTILYRELSACHEALSLEVTFNSLTHRVERMKEESK